MTDKSVQFNICILNRLKVYIKFFKLTDIKYYLSIPQSQYLNILCTDNSVRNSRLHCFSVATVLLLLLNMR